MLRLHEDLREATTQRTVEPHMCDTYNIHTLTVANQTVSAYCVSILQVRKNKFVQAFHVQRSRETEKMTFDSQACCTH